MTPRPTAHGSLSKTPFAHLLLYLQARRLSGTLALWPDASSPLRGQDRVLFEQGELVAMRPLEPAKSLYAALMPLFGRADAAYGFYEGQDLLGEGSRLAEPISLHTLLARGLRAHAPEALVDQVLERVRGRPLRLREGVPLEALELNQREHMLIEQLRRGRATLDTLLGDPALSPRESKRLLYLLTLVRGLEASEGSGSLPAVSIDSFAPPPDEPRMARGTLGDAPPPESSLARGAAARFDAQAAQARPRSSTPSAERPIDLPAREAERSNTPSAPPAPLGLSAPDEARWTEITRLYERADQLTHYELLNLPQGVAQAEVASAYFALVKKFHPDRLPLALAPLARAAQALFERLTEANEVLGNAELRAAYDRAVAGGGGTREADRTLQGVLESTLEYQKADVLMRRREYAPALQLLRSAIAKSPDDADYHALYAWILNLMTPSEPAPFEDMLRALDRALASNPNHERAHYYKGVILKRMKRGNEAMRHFVAASELNPHNVDAAREVRLARMRRPSKPTPSGGGQGGGGMLSRLFKK